MKINKNEQIAYNICLKESIKLNRNGNADFWGYDEVNKPVVVEVKAGNNDLSHEQICFRNWLIKIGIRYIIKYVKKDGSVITAFDSKTDKMK